MGWSIEARTPLGRIIDAVSEGIGMEFQRKGATEDDFYGRTNDIIRSGMKLIWVMGTPKIINAPEISVLNGKWQEVVRRTPSLGKFQLQSKEALRHCPNLAVTLSSYPHSIVPEEPYILTVTWYGGYNRGWASGHVWRPEEINPENFNKIASQTIIGSSDVPRTGHRTMEEFV